MATTVSFNGSSYSVPAVGAARTWGQSLSNYLIAISTGTLQKTGGTFTLTSDVDFGTTYGLKSAYFKSRSSDISTAGVGRLANNESIGWRNQANSSNLLLKVNTSDQLEFNGAPIFGLALGAADYVWRVNSAGTAAEYAKLQNANIAAAAAIALDKLAATTASRALVSDASGFVSASSVTSTQLAYLASATGTTGTTSTNIVFSTSPTITTPSFTTAATMLAAGEMRFNNAGNTFYVGFKAGTLAANKIWTLPTADGSANQVLKTDGSGALGWASVASTVTTTDGDMIYRNSGADTNLAIGTAGKRLRSTGSVPSWAFHQTIKAVGTGDYTADNYTISDSDGYDTFNCTTSTTNRTITLPAAANNSGRTIIIRKVDSPAYTLTISGTINGSTSNNKIYSQYGWCKVTSDGTSWWWDQDIIDQGTWTPVWDATGSSFGATTYNFQYGFWKRNGREVHLDFALEMASTGSVPTGDLVINGIPFTAATSSGQYWNGSCHTSALALSTNYTWATPRIASTGTYISMLQSGSSQSAITVVASANQGPTDRYIIGSLDYRIA